MGRGLAAAWAVGEGIVIWRAVRRSKHLPVPGDLLGITVLFAVLGWVAEYQPLSGPVTLVAWGLDIAGLLDILPKGLSGQIQKAQAAEARDTGVAPSPAAPVAV